MQFIKFSLVFYIFVFSSFVNVHGQEKEEFLLDDESSKELNLLVDQILQKASRPSSSPSFKKLKNLVSGAFGSTPLFLQTLENLKLAEAKKDEAFSGFLPQVQSSLGGGLKSGSNSNGSSKNIKFSVSQLVYDFDVTGSRYSSTKSDAMANEAKVSAKRTELLLRLIEAVHEVYRADMQLKLSNGYVDARKNFLESVKMREEVGGSSNADVLRAEAKVSESLDQIPFAVRKLENSKSSFTELFGNISLPSEMYQLPDVAQLSLVINEENISRLFPIMEIENSLRSAEMSHRAEKRERFGSFRLEAGYQNSDTNLLSPQEQSSVMLSYNLNIFTGYKKTSKIAQSQSRVNSLRFELERLKLEIRREMEESISEYNAQAAAVLSRSELVRGAKVTNKINKELFELNRTSITDLFRAQEEYVGAAKNLLDALIDKNVSYYSMLAKFNQLLNVFELGI
ncbi:MAG: hypothetical protein CBC42_00270 [Betaproteobacteria bacterium TMED82]|nr:MAG: hypothetical protein CBC42_00270 [Betaproteobacteria bacterium TMED82]|tara:strand:- start:9160 stop:10521 length:1362 start_codon:yes stop_codon:yes gene_type:complete